MMRLQYAAPMVLLAFLAACGSIPTDSSDEESGLLPNGTYVNNGWGFRVSRPDSTWGVQVRIYDQSPAPNGVPLLEVWFLAPLASAGDTFRPVLYFAPDALTAERTLNDVVSDIDTELAQIFENYAAGQKQTETIGAEQAARWEFQATESDLNFLPGTQFWAAVVLHGREIYLMVGSGTSEYFPTAGYQQIATSFVLTD